MKNLRETAQNTLNPIENIFGTAFSSHNCTLTLGMCLCQFLSMSRLKLFGVTVCCCFLPKNSCEFCITFYPFHVLWISHLTL